VQWLSDVPLNLVTGFEPPIIPQVRKPLDVLAEGLISEKSRGDRTAIELFFAGLADFSKAVWKLP
jgi:hypothetical protein